jgi:hypothetical protein
MGPKRGRNCRVCGHDKRHLIELALVYRTPSTVLARRFGVSADSIKRHARNHLPAQLKAALLTAQRPSEIDLEKLQASEAEGLLAQLVSQRARLQQHSELALELGDVKAAVACENSIQGNLALVGKLLGQLINVHEVRSTSILVSPDYLQLRAKLVAALRPFPEASAAVGRALHELESAAAKPPLVIDHRSAEDDAA